MNLSTILYGILCSLIAVFLYNILQSLIIYKKLRSLNGEYTEYDNKNIVRTDSKIYVQFIWRTSILNGTGSQLIIRQECKKRGDWESTIPISALNPLIATGNYNYLTGPVKTWGIHQITINLRDKIIYIEATGKSILNSKTYKFWIQKNK